jgi:hypothetical protein
MPARALLGGVPKVERSISHTLWGVTSGGGAAYLLSVAELIACKDASLFDAFSCP